MSDKIYVCGFAFDGQGHIVLIRKLKPEWQRGLYNGVGGKYEKSDLNLSVAMAREFKEETGVETLASEWESKFHYLHFSPPHLGPGEVSHVYYFAADIGLRVTEIQKQENEKEEPEVRAISAIAAGYVPVIPNLHWIIPLCLDKTIVQIGNISAEGI